MSPEKQRIAIAEACGWEFRRNYKSDFTARKIDGCHCTGYKRPNRENDDWCDLFIADSNRFRGDIFDISCWDHVFKFVPDYTSDLNAMHSAVQTLLFSKRVSYRHELQRVMSVNLLHNELVHTNECIDATAAQRAEAFLRTIGKWENDK